MKKIILTFFAVVTVLIGVYYVFSDYKSGQNMVQNRPIAKYSQQNFGIEFTYPVGPTGYSVVETLPTEPDSEFVGRIDLYSTKDKENMDRGNIPTAGEGPVTINIAVFRNINKQFSRMWAESNPQNSNFNLKTSDVSDVVIGGANAVYYTATGLHESKNIVVAHGDSVYVISAPYLDIYSNFGKDFDFITKSINFIPKNGQQ